MVFVGVQLPNINLLWFLNPPLDTPLQVQQPFNKALGMMQLKGPEVSDDETMITPAAKKPRLAEHVLHGVKSTPPPPVGPQTVSWRNVGWRMLTIIITFFIDVYFEKSFFKHRTFRPYSLWSIHLELLYTKAKAMSAVKLEDRMQELGGERGTPLATFHGYDLNKIGVPMDARPVAGSKNMGKHGYTIRSSNNAAPHLKRIAGQNLCLFPPMYLVISKHQYFPLFVVPTRSIS